jgi:ANTAR domain
MMEDWATGCVIGSLHGRRELDMANGVLVALRRCGPDAAFRELLGAAKRHGVGVMAMASAVVDLASCDNQSPQNLLGRPIRQPPTSGPVSSAKTIAARNLTVHND